MIERTDVNKLLDKASIMSISTLADDGRPQAAVVEFANTPDFEIIFDTDTSSRKFANLKRDPRVAVVVGWDDEITVQLEGLAEELSGDELARCKQIYFGKNPAAQKWENEPGTVYVKVTPKWLRYTDLNQNPWEIKEFTF